MVWRNCVFQYLDQHYSMHLPYHFPHPPLTTAGANTLHHKAINSLVQTKTYYLVGPKNYCTRGRGTDAYMHTYTIDTVGPNRNINTLQHNYWRIFSESITSLKVRKHLLTVLLLLPQCILHYFTNTLASRVPTLCSQVEFD